MPRWIKTKIVLCLCLMMPASVSFSQIFDSIRQSLHHKPTFSFRFDNRNTFVSNYSAMIVGLKAGVEFNKRFRVGGGICMLSSKLTRDQIVYDSLGLPDTLVSNLKLDYMEYYIEYVFFHSRRWELSIPIQLGFGNSRYDFLYMGKTTFRDKKFVILYENSLMGHYKIFSWFGIGAGMGYRLMLKKNKAIKENFNSPIYVVKLKIFLNDLYRAVFHIKTE